MNDAINIKQNKEVPATTPVPAPAVKAPEVGVTPEATLPKPVIVVQKESESRDRIRFTGYKRTSYTNKPLVPKKKWFWQ